MLSGSFLIDCAQSRSSLMVSLNMFLLMAQWILLSMSINYYSSSVMYGPTKSNVSVSLEIGSGLIVEEY